MPSQRPLQAADHPNGQRHTNYGPAILGTCPWTQNASPMRPKGPTDAQVALHVEGNNDAIKGEFMNPSIRNNMQILVNSKYK